MPLKTLLGLILTNLIWSAHPLMGKLVLADFTPVQGAWLRYAGALLSFLLLRAALPMFRAEFRAKLQAEPFLFPRTRREWLIVIGVGGMGFCFAPLLQFTGLHASRAMDNALIVAMEPMMTVLLAWLMLKERITRTYAVSLGVALFGFALLTGISAHGLELGEAHFWGDAILLVSLLGEAFYSVGGRKLVARHSAVSIYGLSILIGVIFLTLAVAIFAHETPISLIQALMHQATWKSALALAYLGPLGTTAAYLYWMFALKEAPVASVALTLFVQPVFGSFLGYLFLGERLSLCQSLGGALIILAVFAQTLGFLRAEKPGTSSAT